MTTNLCTISADTVHHKRRRRLPQKFPPPQYAQTIG